MHHDDKNKTAYNWFYCQYHAWWWHCNIRPQSSSLLLWSAPLHASLYFNDSKHVLVMTLKVRADMILTSANTFYPRPLLAFRYYCCLYLSVCPYVCMSVHVNPIQNQFKLKPQNWDKRCKALLFWGLSDFDVPCWPSCLKATDYFSTGRLALFLDEFNPINGMQVVNDDLVT